MGNCLKSQLKASVNNDNLPVFGKFRVYHYQSEDYSLNNQVIVRSQVAGEATVIGGNFVNGSGNSLGTTIQIPANTEVGIRTTNVDCVVYLPLYYMDEIIVNRDYYLHVEDFTNLYSQAEQPLRLIVASRNEFGNTVSAKKQLNFDMFAVEGTGYTGDISNIHASTFVCQAALLYGTIHYYGISGRNTQILMYNGSPSLSIDFAELVTTTLSNLQVRNLSGGGDIGTLNFDNSITTIDLPKGATGSVESLVEKLWTNGKRSGNILFSCYNGASPTLNGNNLKIISSDFNIEFSANEVKIRNYFAQNYIATYNGSTWTYV